MSEIDPQLLEALRSAVALNPGDPDYPVLAELLRRAGRLAEAEAVVTEGLLAAPESLAGRCVLLLILDDRGRGEQLRGRLEAWAEEAVRERLPEGGSAAASPASEDPAARSDGAAAPLSESELDEAFDSAEPELEAMVTPDSVAEEAALRVDGPYATQSPLEESSTFATRTMAELLERQGDAEGAARIRAALERRLPPETGVACEPGLEAAGAAPRAGGGLLSTLERWLSNARRMQA